MASEPEVVEIPEDDEATIEGEEDVLEDDPLDARLCALMSDTIFKGFESHVQELKEARKRRQEALAFKSAVEEEGAAAAIPPPFPGRPRPPPTLRYQS